MGEIRDATEADTEALVELTARTWRKAYLGIVPPGVIADLPRERWRTGLAGAVGAPEAGFARVAELEEDGIVGYCHVATPGTEEPPGSPIAELVAIYVDPAHWGRGVGRALLTTAGSEASRAGFAGMILWSFERNAQARAFYARLGWARDGESRPHAATGVQTVRLRRALQPPE